MAYLESPHPERPGNSGQKARSANRRGASPTLHHLSDVNQRLAKKVVLIGDGWMAQEALRLLEDHPAVDLAAVFHHANPAHGFRRLRPIDVRKPNKLIECGNVNDTDILRRIDDFKPDLIFSVNNFDIIRESLLGIPVDGIVNFHNGKLPTYRGVNIPSWAIIRGETRHTVTWHLVAPGIDAGPIVCEHEFELSKNETGISLILKCIDLGLRLLPGIVDDYTAGTLQTRAQEGEAHYYSAKDTPNGGLIEFSSPFTVIDRLVRGLTFHPFRNSFVSPHFETEGGPLIVGRAVRENIASAGQRFAPGQVIDIADGVVIVKCADAAVALEYLTDAEGENVTRHQIQDEFGVAVGTRI